jgi:hypothetical protein
LEIRRAPGTSSSPRIQQLWLNFEGVSALEVREVELRDVGAFDPSGIAPRYADDAVLLREAIVDCVRRHYAPFGVSVSSSSDGPAPQGPFSVVHFGGDHATLLGLADAVDPLNADLTQQAVVFTDRFAAYAGMQLDASQLAQMIGNVAAHEAGHLLGLYHTAAPADLMDTTGTAWDLVGDRSLSRAPLAPSVFPVGYQHAGLLLGEALGTGGVAIASKAAARDRESPAAAACWCGSCAD